MTPCSNEVFQIEEEASPSNRRLLVTEEPLVSEQPTQVTEEPDLNLKKESQEGDTSDTSVIEKQQVTVKIEKDQFMIRTNDGRKTLWDMFVIVIAIWNCACIPLQICFEPPQLESLEVQVLNTLIDLCFVADIVACCRTTYYDEETGDEIFTVKRTALRYIKSARFTMDLLSTIPFDTIGFVITRQKTPALQLFALLKLARVSRITAIISRLNVDYTTK